MINKIKNIHCLALNYKGVGNIKQKPLYFVKSLNTLVNNNSRIAYPKNTTKLWTEVELAIIINKDCQNVSVSDANNYIGGITVACDMTRENIEGRDHHLGYSKSITGFCPILDKIIHVDDLDLNNVKLTTKINGITTQMGNTKDMVYNVQKSISYISSFTKLRQYDIILTGTPSGVENNVIKKGDNVIATLNDLSLNFDII